jgi:hypothetical protein
LHAEPKGDEKRHEAEAFNLARIIPEKPHSPTFFPEAKTDSTASGR